MPGFWSWQLAWPDPSWSSCSWLAPAGTCMWKNYKQCLCLPWWPSLPSWLWMPSWSSWHGAWPLQPHAWQNTVQNRTKITTSLTNMLYMSGLCCPAVPSCPWWPSWEWPSSNRLAWNALEPNDSIWPSWLWTSWPPWLGKFGLVSTSAHWNFGPAAEHNQQSKQMENAYNDMEALSALHEHGQPNNQTLTRTWHAWKMHTMTWKHLVLYMNMVNQTIKH